MKCYFNQKLIDPSEANINMMSPTAQFGINIFEGIRAYYDQKTNSYMLFRIEDHLKRLYESAKIASLEIAESKDQILDSLTKVIKTADFKRDIALRLIAYQPKEGSWHDEQLCSIFISPMQLKRKVSKRSLSAQISSWRRIEDNSMPSRAKVGSNYMNSRYAVMAARASGYDTSIFLTSSGKISEGVGSCLVLYKNGELLTPPTTASNLDSITRDTIKHIAEFNNIKYFVRDLDRSDIYTSDEVFLCGTAVEIQPINSVDHITFKENKITHELSDLYFKTVLGEILDKKNWTHNVHK